MTFGFTVHYKEIIETELSVEELTSSIRDAVVKLGWHIRVEGNDIIIASIRMKFWPSGEVITIRIDNDRNVLIESRC